MSTTTQPMTSAPCAGPEGEVPPFQPHPWLSDPHIQTIVARFWPWPRYRLPSIYVEVDAGGGDRLSVLESIPEGWSASDPSVLMVHGLGGCARSPYIVRVARRLVDAGARVVRMNLRNAGSSFGLARSFYHGGKTDDLRVVAEWLGRRTLGSPLALLGFSLGANLVLKLAAEAADRPLEGLDCVVAANPPLDLNASCERIREPPNWIYDRNFLRELRAEVGRLHAAFPELGPIDLSSARSLLEFDEIYTAPRNGFLNAIDYYARSSARASIHRIAVPGLVIHAEDDPFIPAEPFRSIAFPPRLALELIPRGGHLGYLSRKPWRGNRRWLDARITAWLTSRWESGSIERAATSR